MLEALGVQIELPPDAVERCLREIGIGFMFAPAYHPAMRYAAAGPKGNRDSHRVQRSGAHDESGRRFLPTHRRWISGGRRKNGGGVAIVRHPTTPSSFTAMTAWTKFRWAAAPRDGKLWTEPLSHTWCNHATLAFLNATPEDLRGGNPAENAATMLRVLAGAEDAITDAVVLNSGAALVAGDMVATLSEGIEMAKGSIHDGKATEKLEVYDCVDARAGWERRSEGDVRDAKHPGQDCRHQTGRTRRLQESRPRSAR